MRRHTRLSATVFERRGRDLIDFVQAPGETIFRAQNLRRVRTRGVEMPRRWLTVGLRWEGARKEHAAKE